MVIYHNYEWGLSARDDEYFEENEDIIDNVGHCETNVWLMRLTYTKNVMKALS